MVAGQKKPFIALSAQDPASSFFDGHSPESFFQQSEKDSILQKGRKLPVLHYVLLQYLPEPAKEAAIFLLMR
jgi:hypothetical protein